MDEWVTAAVRGFEGKRILVLGDLFLDEYLEGRAERLSREAPVPVVELSRRETIPGGAANPAHNVVALGGQCIVTGIVGDDEDGRTLVGELRRLHVDTSGVVIDGERRTTTKTRVVAFRDALRFPQHLARIDRIDRRPVSSDVATRVRDRIDVLIPQTAAVLVSDYRSGMLTPEIVRTVLERARACGVRATVDAQGELEQYRGFDLIKCNRAEAEGELGLPLRVDADYERALAALVDRLDAGAVVVTRGPEGLSYCERDGGVTHLPAANRTEVFDVTGAGDTVIAVLTLGLASGLPLSSAALLANAAAGLVVQQLGNAVVTPAELVAAAGRDR